MVDRFCYREAAFPKKAVNRLCPCLSWVLIVGVLPVLTDPRPVCLLLWSE